MKVSGVEVSLKRSDRKTVSIFVERDGSVSARVPKSLSDDEVEEVIKSKEYQIFRNLTEWSLLNDARKTREFVNGQSFLYLGRNYRLKIIESEEKTLMLKRGFFELPESESDQADRLFKEFYRTQLSLKLDVIVPSFSSKLNVSPKEIKVMELQNRWASCSENHNLNFHWKCAMAPIAVIHYIVAHELVHLKHRNHTSQFWNEVDKIYPNYLKQVEWLKQNGAGMDL